MHIYIYVHAYIHTYVYVYVCMRICKPTYTCTCLYLYIRMIVQQAHTGRTKARGFSSSCCCCCSFCLHACMHTHLCDRFNTRTWGGYEYGVATISRLRYIIGLFCRISSLL